MTSVSLVSFNGDSALCTYLRKSAPQQIDDSLQLRTKNEITPPPGFSRVRKDPSPKSPPSPLRIVKKEICMWFLNGECRFGSNCRNIHEFRTPAQYDEEIFTKLYEEISPLSKTCKVCPDSPVSSNGSETDFELDSDCATDNEDRHRFPGVYIIVDGQLQFVPDVNSSDPDILVCWDFNTRLGCTYPQCTWEHRPCQTTKAHPTKIGRICSPQFGLQNLQKEHEQMKHQKRKLQNLGFL